MPPSSSTSSRRTYLFPGRPMAAPLDVPVGYHIAMGAPLGLHASASSSPSTPHPDPPAPPAHQARRPDSYQHRRTAAMSTSAWLRRTTAGTPGHCTIGAGGPPHRQSTSTPGRSAAAALHHRSSPTRRREPASPPPSTPRRRPQGRGCGGGFWGSSGCCAAGAEELLGLLLPLPSFALWPTGG